jgi:hypothetical protein
MHFEFGAVMPKTLSFDPIKYLISRSFPAAKSIAISSSFPTTESKHTKKLIGKIQAYEAELLAKLPEEIEALCRVERVKENAELKEREEQEEQQSFFNETTAAADFEHWSQTAYWSLDEAVALCLGKDPRHVNWANVKVHVRTSPFAKEYARLKDLVDRAEVTRQLSHRVAPCFFLAWAERCGISYPESLESALVARDLQIGDWKTAYDRLERQFNENAATANRDSAKAERLIVALKQERDELRQKLSELGPDPKTLTVLEKSLSTRERQTVLKLIIGMAINGYGFDPAAKRSEQISAIADDLAKLGLNLDPDTIRKWLHEGREILPRGTENSP